VEASPPSWTVKGVPAVGKEKLTTTGMSAGASSAATLREVETQERASVEKRTNSESRAARDKLLHANQQRQQELPIGLPNRTRGTKLCLRAQVGDSQTPPLE
jgi:hypothetical protein